MNTIVRLLLLLCAMLTGAVQAQSSGSATLSSLHYTLADLDPNDGITPSLTWVSGVSGIRSHAFASAYAEGDEFATYRYIPGNVAFAPVLAGLDWGVARSSSALSGSLESGFTLQASAAIVGERFEGAFSAEVSTGQFGFVLSPMTAASFSSDVALFGGPAAASAQTPDGVHLQAQMWLYYDPLGDGFIDHESTGWFAFPGSSAPGNTVLAMTVSNARGTDLYSELDLYASVHLATAALPVPEPSAWIMLAAGLALLRVRGRALQQS